LVYEDGKQRRWTGTSGGGSWRRPRPTQGCTVSKEEDGLTFIVFVINYTTGWLKLR
jgi:hypothetical protein